MKRLLFCLSLLSLNSLFAAVNVEVVWPQDKIEAIKALCNPNAHTTFSFEGPTFSDVIPGTIGCCVGIAVAVILVDKYLLNVDENIDTAKENNSKINKRDMLAYMFGGLAGCILGDYLRYLITGKTL